MDLKVKCLKVKRMNGQLSPTIPAWDRMARPEKTNDLRLLRMPIKIGQQSGAGSVPRQKQKQKSVLGAP
jgi:hypothetical protein